MPGRDRSMRLRFTVVLMVSSACGCTGGRHVPPHPTAWQEIVSTECGFVVLMPGVPQLRQGIDRRGNQVVEYRVIVPPGYLHVATCASADESREGEAAEAFVRSRLEFEKAAVEQQRWPVREARLVRVGKCPGWQLVTDNPDGLEVGTRFVWAGDRAFVLIASGPPDPVTREVAARLFESLRSDRCQPPP